MYRKLPFVKMSYGNVWFWVGFVLVVGLAGVCGVYTVRLLIDGQYRAQIAAGGDSVAGQIGLGAFGTLFFGAAAGLVGMLIWVRARYKAHGLTPPPVLRTPSERPGPPDDLPPAED